MNDVMESVDNRVMRGVALLDEKYHRWDSYITTNVGAFDMADPFRCILGQLYGTFGEGKERLFGRRDELQAPSFSADYGFDTNGEDSYAELNEAWRAVLEARR